MYLKGIWKLSLSNNINNSGTAYYSYIFENKTLIFWSKTRKTIFTCNKPSKFFLTPFLKQYRKNQQSLFDN